MFNVMGFMIAGIFIGYLLRRYKIIFRIIGKLNMWIIFLLLFTMGLSIGNNHQIMSNFGKYGISAILIGIAATTGSVLLAIPIYKYLFKEKNNTQNEK